MSVPAPAPVPPSSPSSPPSPAAPGNAPGPSSRPPWRRVLPPLLLALVTIASLLPFVDKPFHLDDPMYLWVADQIRREPLDFYGFAVNWHGTMKPVPEVMQNPPLVSYYVALVDLLFGRSERALHAAFLLPAVAAVLGTYFLARELACGTHAAALAALLTLFTPVFLVSASTIMVDVSMLASWVWAVWAWVRGLDRDRPALLWLAATLVAVCTLTKYFGAALLPLLLAYGIVRRGRARWWDLLPPLLLPVAVLTGYHLWTRQLYGRGLLLDAGLYATVTRSAQAAPLARRLLTGLSFVGGGGLTIALAMLCLQRTRAVLMWVGALAAVMVLLLAWDPYPHHPLHGPDGRVNPLYWGQLGLFVTAGAGVIAAAVAHVRRLGWRDSHATLLLLWVLGTLAFASLLNWTVSARSVLAIAPAAAIVAARSFEAGLGTPPRRVVLILVLLIGAALSLACVLADTVHAQAARRAARDVHDQFRGHARPLFFLGHWGFQYYMERLGARPLDPLAGDVRGGDLIVVPLNNSYNLDIAPAAPGALPVVHAFATPTLPWLATMDETVAAGFYSDVWGPLPYAFGRVPPDRYLVKRIEGPIQPVLRSQQTFLDRTDRRPAARTGRTGD